jgi:predicted heme/steroid binding protein
MLLLTEVELSKYDGTGCNPAYVAYKGKIYDVSNCPNWIDGTHYQHIAGQDLTESMADAPHSEEVIVNSPIVGELVMR